MIISIWGLLITIAFTCGLMSFWMESDSTKIDTVIILRIVSTMIIFLMGLPMMQGNIEYKTGANITTSGTNITITDTYTSYQNQTIGWLILILGGFGFALTMWEIRNIRREGYEDD